MRDRSESFRTLVLALGPRADAGDMPWWWQEIRHDPDLCELSYQRVTVRNKRSKQIRTWELPWLFVKILWLLLRARSKYDYVFTFENDFTSFAVAFWQTVLFLRRPRHVIALFIMREKTASFSSRLKYAVMKLMFGSVYAVVCSSTVERDYYTEAFGWPEGKACFARLPAMGALLEHETRDDDGYIFAGGRVYRDYGTLAAAIRGKRYRTIIVAEKPHPDIERLPNVEATHGIPIDEFNRLLSAARVVALPLEDKKFSVGQTVLLQAMAMGKAVITTRTAGTVDYIDHMKTGIFVEPGDSEALASAVELLMTDPDLRARLGNEAKQAIRSRFLPHHYTRSVRGLLARDGSARAAPRA